MCMYTYICDVSLSLFLFWALTSTHTTTFALSHIQYTHEHIYAGSQRDMGSVETGFVDDTDKQTDASCIFVIHTTDDGHNAGRSTVRVYVCVRVIACACACVFMC